MATEINLSVEALVEKVNAVKHIDEAISKQKGTAAQRRTKAEDKVKAENAELVAEVEAARQALAELEHTFTDKVDEVLKDTQDTKKLDGLKTQRATLVDEADAMRKVLEAFKVDVSGVETPGKAPRTTSGGGGTRTSGSRFYRIEDGNRAYYSKDNLSGMAWFGFKQAGAEALKQALSEAGVTELTKPFETDVTCNGITRRIGMEVLVKDAETTK